MCHHGERTQVEQVDLSMGRERLLARLLTVFGGFALLLACIGLYGATAYSVARRTNEIGVRVALGARRPEVLWLILRQALMPVAGRPWHRHSRGNWPPRRWSVRCSLGWRHGIPHERRCLGSDADRRARRGIRPGATGGTD
jgi:hypothetical protein